MTIPCCAVSSVRFSTIESSCLRVQLKAGGKFHLKLNISKRPIANKYREGKMQRTLKRELKGLEIAEREADGASTSGPQLVRRRRRILLGGCVSASVHAAGARLSGGSPSGCLPASCAVARTEEKFLRMLTKWRHPTRLETRTKESNIYASTRATTPCAK